MAADLRRRRADGRRRRERTDAGGGDGGSGPAAAGAGVVAGGGGEGAPDFSRPKPGSKGKTPGGARITHRPAGDRARDHSPARRGANQHQAEGSETAEPRRADEADQEVETVAAAEPAPSDAPGGEAGGGDKARRDEGEDARGAALPTDGARRRRRRPVARSPAS